MLPSSHRLEGLGLSGASRNRDNEEASDCDETEEIFLPTCTTLRWTVGELNELLVPQEGIKTDDEADHGGTASSEKVPGLKIYVGQLVIGCNFAADAFLSCMCSDLTEIGVISSSDATSQVWSLRANIGGGKFQASSKISKLIVIRACSSSSQDASQSINVGEEWRWIEPLFQNVNMDEVVVLDTVKVASIPMISAAEGKPQAPYLYKVGTSEFTKLDEEIDGMTSTGTSLGSNVSLQGVPDLPSPLLLEGLGASALVCCEARSIRAVAVISLIERVVDSSTLFGYEKAFGLESRSEEERRARKLVYRNAVKGASKKLDALYL